MRRAERADVLIRQTLKFFMAKGKRIFVFDFNGTLLARVKDEKGKMLRLRKPEGVMSNGDLVYLRPHFGELVEYLHANGIRYMLWTTAMEHNAVQMMEILRRHGMTRPIAFFTQKESTPIANSFKRAKRIQHVCDRFGVSIEDVFLIDDHDFKCIPVECHIPVETYDPKSSSDKALLEIVEKIGALARK